MRVLLNVLLVLLISTIGPTAFAAETDVGDYLILEDIGGFQRITDGGPSGDILAGADHFFWDHADRAYGIAYVSDAEKLWVDVQVTQHAGPDSDKWLLHEVEDGFRDPDVLNAKLSEGARVRELGDSKIFFYGGGVVAYSWINSNVVIVIKYTNLSGPKPEPLEIVKAYLAKFPSSITLTDKEAKSSVHNERWIKDELERRLWLADKWLLEQQDKDGDLAERIREMTDHLAVFLGYRERYYGGSAKKDGAILLEARRTNDISTIQKWRRSAVWVVSI